MGAKQNSKIGNEVTDRTFQGSSEVLFPFFICPFPVLVPRSIYVSVKWFPAIFVAACFNDGRDSLTDFQYFVQRFNLAAHDCSSLPCGPEDFFPSVSSGAPNENIVENQLNIAFLNVFSYLNDIDIDIDIGRFRHNFIP